MTIRVYASTDTGAQVAYVSAGQVKSVFQQCLVDGYNLGTVSSITRSGSTATITFSAAHGMVKYGNYITIAGADQAEYNGEFECTVSSTTALTFTVSGTPASPATGTITARKAGSGWTMPYTGTNKAAFKQGTGSNGFYFRLDDSFGVAYSRAVGYETMSDVDTGTGAFPTAVQMSGGDYLIGSNTSGVARPWFMIATSKWFIYYCDKYNDGSVTGVIHFFGDIDSEYYTTDSYNTLCGLHSSTSSTNNGVAWTNASGTIAGEYIARDYTQIGGSANVLLRNSIQNSTMTISGSATHYPSYPDVIENKLKYSRILINDVPSTKFTAIRGKVPALYHVLHNRPLTPKDTFTGSDTLTNIKLLVLGLENSGQIFVRLTGADSG